MGKYINKIGEESNVFNDNIAFVHQYDFSRSNLNDESRIEAITTVASICYDNPNAVGKESLYNRLKAEAIGLPSSSFEFVPVLLTVEKFKIISGVARAYDLRHSELPTTTLNIGRYGEWILEKGENYLLTNYRAILHDWEKIYEDSQEDFTQWFNTEDEAKIIKKHSKSFLYKMDLSTSKQHNRHRVSLQELSRRYVSGKKTAFEFYTSEKMKDVKTQISDIEGVRDFYSTEYITAICIEHYFNAISNGVTAQEARRILPQSMYTTIWSAFLPFQLSNYLALRDDLHAQEEIRWLAQAMKRLLAKE